MERSPLVRLLMSQERLNDLGRRLIAEPIGGVVPTGDASSMRVQEVCEADSLAGGRVAAMQENMDREARSSLVISWLGLEGPPADWG